MPAKEYYLPKRKLVSQDDASVIQNNNIPRSRFQGSWTRKTTFNAGNLVPFMVEEVLPGDHLTYDVTAYVRLSTPLFPLFDSQRIDTFFFFVPCRLVWANWAKFMGEQTNPGDSIDYTIPVINGTIGGEAQNSLYDHFGIPVNGQIDAGQNLDVNALPLRAYNLIYNEWFRDQNLFNAQPVPTDDGPDTAGDYILVNRAKSHDYFTSALPWPQKFTAPNVPVAGQAPIIGIGFDPINTPSGSVTVNETGGETLVYPWAITPLANPAQVWFRGAGSSNTDPLIFANLSEATGVSINVFRQAFMIQTLLERDARGGTRYVEKIWSQFGVRNPDFRLQRPEYIGGGQSPLNITPIAQTAPTEDAPLGALGGAGTAAGQHRASYAATEHGYIIALINVRTELSYQQGLHKLWSRRTQYDFYIPALAQLGEQAILRQELFCIGQASEDETVFGYQERWQEYRTRVSEVTGMFRSTQTGAIDGWHLAQLFAGAPNLNATFLIDNPPMNRVLAAGASSNNMQYLADILIRRTAVRPIPTFGTPVTLGRF